MSRKSILLIEDDPQIQALLAEQVDLLGYDLAVANDGLLGLKKALDEEHALVLLDVNLPSLGGIEICRKIRDEKPDQPLIMVSARGSELDKVLGLQLGADDYIVKPFSVAELAARIQARLRRQAQQLSAVPVSPSTSATVVLGDFEISPERREVKKKGILLTLTALEFDLLHFFAANPGVVFSREQLLDKVWNVHTSAYENSPTACINRLRKKIEDDPANPKHLLTVWGVGYRFAGESS